MAFKRSGVRLPLAPPTFPLQPGEIFAGSASSGCDSGLSRVSGLPEFPVKSPPEAFRAAVRAPAGREPVTGLPFRSTDGSSGRAIHVAPAASAPRGPRRDPPSADSASAAASPATPSSSSNPGCFRRSRPVPHGVGLSQPRFHPHGGRNSRPVLPSCAKPWSFDPSLARRPTSGFCVDANASLKSSAAWRRR